MKKRIANLFIFITICTSFFAACADYDNEYVETVSVYESMDKWMKSNRADIPFIDSGIYYKIYENHADLDTLMPIDSTLVEIMVTGKTLNGDFFLNSYKETAAQLGDFTYKTNYVPFRYNLNEHYLYPFTNKGINNALSKMKVGDSAMIFLSPDNSYGDVSSGEGEFKQYLGFNGSRPYSDKSVSSFTVKLEKIEVSPRDTALKHVIDYAKNVLNINAKDSIEKGFYVKRLDSIGGGEFIGEKDTTLKVRFTGYLLNGFVFETNDKEIAKKHNIYDITSKYNPYLLVLSDGSTNGSIDVFNLGVKVLKPGDKATIITIPEWGYGKKGSYNFGSTIIQTYTPLIYDIEILLEDEY